MYEGESDRDDICSAHAGEDAEAEYEGSVWREGGGDISGVKKPSGLEVE